MKARVKATGAIVEVEEYHKYLETGWKYKDNAGTLYKPSALDFSDEAVIGYWTRLEHQYAGMALQGILANSEFDEVSVADIAITSIKVATSVIKRLKEERK